jgi:hypothetical protein
MIPDQRTDASERLASRVLVALFILAFLYMISVIILFDIERLITTMPDDAGYFLEIAENAAGGKGLTFDGINRTNGFQPLWLYILVALYSAVRAAPETMMRIGMALQAVMALLAGLIVYSVHSRFFSKKTGLISGIVFVFFVFFLSVNLMESAVLVLTLSILFFVGWKGNVFNGNSRGWQLVFGIVLGLAFLARLDSVFICIAIFFFCLAKIIGDPERRANNIKRLLVIMIGAAMPILPYMTFNLVSFGSIMPISGGLKTSFPHISGPYYAFSRLTKRNWGEISVTAVYFVWFIVQRMRSAYGRDKRNYFRTGMAVLALAVLMHFLHTVLFMKWAIFRWQFATYTLLVVMVISEPVEYLMSGRLFRNSRILYWGLSSLMIIAGCLVVARRHTQPLELNWTVESYRAALWSRQNSDETDVFAMKDAGIFGYFCQRRVINLDGVVNTMEYQDILKERRLNEYLDEHKVRYLVQHAFFRREDITDGRYDTYSMSYPSHKYESESDEITLRKEDEVYRSGVFWDGPHRTVFLIFRR